MFHQITLFPVCSCVFFFWYVTKAFQVLPTYQQQNREKRLKER